MCPEMKAREGLPVPALVGKIAKKVGFEKKMELKDLLVKYRDREVNREQFKKQLVVIAGTAVVRDSIRALRPDIEHLITEKATGKKRGIDTD
jgi:hypothetical protein